MLSLSREKICKDFRPRPIAYAIAKGLRLRPHVSKRLRDYCCVNVVVVVDKFIVGDVFYSVNNYL